VSTKVDIDTGLVEALLARHPGVTPRVAVERVISAHLATDAVARTKALVGRLRIEDVSAELRTTGRTSSPR